MVKWSKVDVQPTRRRGAPSKVSVSEDAVALIQAWLDDASAPDVLPFSLYPATASLADGGAPKAGDNVSPDTFRASEADGADDARKVVATVRERLRRNLAGTVKGKASVTVFETDDGYTFGLTR